MSVCVLNHPGHRGWTCLTLDNKPQRLILKATVIWDKPVCKVSEVF